MFVIMVMLIFFVLYIHSLGVKTEGNEKIAVYAIIGIIIVIYIVTKI